MKYIFIDTNQYRHIFSENEGFSEDIIKILLHLIDKKHIKLLLPKQVKDEVERNRFESWYLNEKKSIKKSVEVNSKKIQELSTALDGYKPEFDKIKTKIEKENKILEKKLKEIKTRFRGNRSKANQRLRDIFKKAEYIEETESIVSSARLRLDRGNPPHDNKLGDTLIWESLLSFLKQIKEKSTLIFIARDKKAWGKEGLNLWLEKEMKSVANTGIIFTSALADIDELTLEDRQNIKQIERGEQKKNVLSDFLGVYGYIDASIKLERLLPFKDILTVEDYKEIIKEFLNNSSIIYSYYTSWKVKSILTEDDSNYLIEKISNLKSSILDEINKKYELSLRVKKVSDELEF